MNRIENLPIYILSLISYYLDEEDCIELISIGNKTLTYKLINGGACNIYMKNLILYTGLQDKLQLSSVYLDSRSAYLEQETNSLRYSIFPGSLTNVYYHRVNYRNHMINCITRPNNIELPVLSVKSGLKFLRIDKLRITEPVESIYSFFETEYPHLTNLRIIQLKNKSTKLSSWPFPPNISEISFGQVDHSIIEFLPSSVTKLTIESFSSNKEGQYEFLTGKNLQNLCLKTNNSMQIYPISLTYLELSLPSKYQLKSIDLKYLINLITFKYSGPKQGPSINLPTTSLKNIIMMESFSPLLDTQYVLNTLEVSSNSILPNFNGLIFKNLLINKLKHNRLCSIDKLLINLGSSIFLNTIEIQSSTLELIIIFLGCAKRTLPQSILLVLPTSSVLYNYSNYYNVDFPHLYSIQVNTFRLIKSQNMFEKMLNLKSLSLQFIGRHPNNHADLWVPYNLPENILPTTLTHLECKMNRSWNPYTLTKFYKNHRNKEDFTCYYLSNFPTGLKKLTYHSCAIAMWISIEQFIQNSDENTYNELNQFSGNITSGFFDTITHLEWRYKKMVSNPGDMLFEITSLCAMNPNIELFLKNYLGYHQEDLPINFTIAKKRRTHMTLKLIFLMKHSLVKWFNTFTILSKISFHTLRYEFWLFLKQNLRSGIRLCVENVIKIPPEAYMKLLSTEIYTSPHYENKSTIMASKNLILVLDQKEFVACHKDDPYRNVKWTLSNARITTPIPNYFTTLTLKSALKESIALKKFIDPETQKYNPFPNTLTRLKLSIFLDDYYLYPQLIFPTSIKHLEIVISHPIQIARDLIHSLPQLESLFIYVIQISVNDEILPSMEQFENIIPNTITQLKILSYDFDIVHHLQSSLATPNLKILD